MNSELSGALPQRWLHLCSISVLFVALVFLCASLFAFNYHDILSSHLIPALVSTLVLTIYLNVYILLYIRKEHRSEDRAFREADREFSSIFQTVLDGILIVDGSGTCLDANPAAAAILRCPLPLIVGHSIARFFVSSEEFEKDWESFLEKGISRGRAHLLAGDATELFVEFTASANYLPGRHALVICDVTERTLAEASLRESEARFEEMADNIVEIFWRIDAQTQELSYVNPAYAKITGHEIETLRSIPLFYRELIHPEDRIRVLSKLQETLTTGCFDEEFRFTRADGAVRWMWAKGSTVPNSRDPRRIVGTAQDITARKQAEMRLSEQLDMVEAARAEAEALRKATLALSQNLAMDSVLDTLLCCIGDLVPFDKAAVLFVEEGAELLIARESPRSIHSRTGTTISVSTCTFFEEILFERKCVLLQDLAKETGRNRIKPLSHVQSWIGVPLVAAEQVLGILSLGKTCSGAYTSEHLRLAKSLAVPAAVAIKNARVHERAEIYASELQLRLEELKAAEHRLKAAATTPPRDTLN